MSEHAKGRVAVTFVNLENYRKGTRYLQDRIQPMLDSSSLVLDAGCGSWNRMVHAGSTCRLVGGDVDLARLSANRQIAFGVVMDLHKQPFREQAFDLVVCNDVVEHLEHPVGFVSACYRLLKNGGYIFIATPNRNSLFGLLAALTPLRTKQMLLKGIYGSTTTNEVHWYRLNTVSAFKSVLQDEGFSDISIALLNKLPDQPRARVAQSWYFQLCKLPFFRMLSPGLFCTARKTVSPGRSHYSTP